MTLKLENMIDSILYTLLFLFFGIDIKNDKDIFLFNDLLSLSNQNKIKKLI